MTERTVVSLYQAKTHLSELGERAARGEEIVVTKHGKPRFRILGIGGVGRRGPGGNPMGISYVAENFDEPDEDLDLLFGTRHQ